MQDLIPLQTLVDEVEEVLRASSLPCQAYSRGFEDNNGTLILTTMPWMTP